jgi:hypothetical protein
MMIIVVVVVIVTMVSNTNVVFITCFQSGD